MKRTVAALATLAAACAPAKPAAQISGRKEDSCPTAGAAGTGRSATPCSGAGAAAATSSTTADLRSGPTSPNSESTAPTRSEVTVTTAAPTTTTVAPFVMPEAETPATDAEWWAAQPGYSGALPLPPAWVSQRESHDDYTAVNSAGYYGRWQFSRSTWNATAAAAGRGDLVGVRPDKASPADQDAMAAELWSDGAGCSHWAACG